MQKERGREGWRGVTGSRTGTGQTQIERERKKKGEKERKRKTDWKRHRDKTQSGKVRP